MEQFSNIFPLLVWAFVATQFLYSLSFLVEAYHFSKPVNWVDMKDGADAAPGDYPRILLLYPVLRELEATMRTTFKSIGALDYPAEKYRVVAVPNASDLETVASLRRLTLEFPFLEILEVPPTSDPSWEVIWTAWSANDAAYWWRKGPRAGVRDLPPKKTRQLIYAFYHAAEAANGEEFLVNYIDADSCLPPDHFKAGMAGMRRYDVLQAQNVAGNLNASLAASWHAFDHMAWDGLKYPHLSADGKQPYWMLGKGLFFKASDLIDLGGFHPWLTIEDPEVGMRFWAAGKRLGVIEGSLVEEVPETFARGVTQRKRWVCGFFQSLGSPLRELGLSPAQKFRAWMNFLPCLSLWINAVGLPVGVWALWGFLTDKALLPAWTVPWATVNVAAFLFSMTALYVHTWKRTALVLDRKRDRIFYMLRINPLFIMVWWVMWLIPLAIGFWMYLHGHGLVWERTEKLNANQKLVEGQIQAANASRGGAR